MGSTAKDVKEGYMHESWIIEVLYSIMKRKIYEIEWKSLQVMYTVISNRRYLKCSSIFIIFPLLSSDVIALSCSSLFPSDLI